LANTYIYILSWKKNQINICKHVSEVVFHQDEWPETCLGLATWTSNIWVRESNFVKELGKNMISLQSIKIHGIILYKSSEPKSYEATWIGFSLFRNCLFLVASL